MAIAMAIANKECVYTERGDFFSYVIFLSQSLYKANPKKKWLLIFHPLFRFLQDRYVLITHIMTKLNNFFDIKLKKASLSGKKLS